ncbi:RING finger and WD repeat domain-containing protein 3 [Podila epigama]|nr:RING finger and WD repeat domain-containing protein 3 [Podila epigama]
MNDEFDIDAYHDRVWVLQERDSHWSSIMPAVEEYHVVGEENDDDDLVENDAETITEPRTSVASQSLQHSQRSPPRQLTPSVSPTAVTHDGIDQDEQDSDFQTQTAVVVRARAGTGIASESTCSICFEPWTNSGGHRLVSIKCGHLFGESRPAKRNDIRRLWSKSVVTVDTAKMDETAAKLKKEQEARARAERDLANSKLAYEMLKIQMANLQKKHDRQRSIKLKYKSQVKRIKMSTPQEDINKKFSYVAFKTMAIPDAIKPIVTSQYLSYRANEEMLVCSRHERNSFGIAKVSMRDFSNNLHNFIPIHSKPIRDVQCYTSNTFSNAALVLTASMDNFLKITSANSQQVVLSYDVKAPVWSCCWSKTNPFTVYCASKGRQSSINTFDIRNTSAPVDCYSDPKLLGLSPIHSMVHIGSCHSKTREGILCGNLQSAFVYNIEVGSKSMGSSQPSATVCQESRSSIHSMAERAGSVQVPGASCYSVSFDDTLMQWMASYKSLGKGFTEHRRGTFDLLALDGDLFLNDKDSVTGGPPVPSLSRTSIFSRTNGAVHMAVGSEGLVNVWCEEPETSKVNASMTTSSCVASSQDDGPRSSLEMVTLRPHGSSTIPLRDPVMDVKPVVVGAQEYLVALADRSLQLYRWTAETLLYDSELSDDEDIVKDEEKGREKEDKEGGGKDDERAQDVELATHS